jgi:hypothetical protein
MPVGKVLAEVVVEAEGAANRPGPQERLDFLRTREVPHRARRRHEHGRCRRGVVQGEDPVRLDHRRLDKARNTALEPRPRIRHVVPGGRRDHQDLRAELIERRGELGVGLDAVLLRRLVSPVGPRVEPGDVGYAECLEVPDPPLAHRPESDDEASHSGLRVSVAARDAPGQGVLVSRKSPSARYSMPLLKKVFRASSGDATMGSPLMLNEVLSTIGKPVSFRN